MSGRPVDLGDAAWLAGPCGDEGAVGDAWLDREAARVGGRVLRGDPGAGLLDTMARLDGPGFTAASLAPEVRDFYEQTARWRLDVRMRWWPPAWPFGWLISAVHARRLRQLSLPLRARDLTDGMTSTVVPVTGPDGVRAGTLWLRRLRATGAVVYSGWYGTATLPGAAPRDVRDGAAARGARGGAAAKEVRGGAAARGARGGAAAGDAPGGSAGVGERRPSVRVVFPLPNGRLVVLLRPEVTAGGGLRLTSPRGAWGGDGAYLVVERRGRAWARRIPVHETFHVYVDPAGTLRTDHDLRLWRLPALRLHYRMSRQPEADQGVANRVSTASGRTPGSARRKIR
ncbi:MAG: hypothetical protein GEV11_22330 [Streptosporangiales bacterium]|nr:hypothetical protein [Streptosporangiales bacterium]